MKSFHIYKITNLATNKIYIGQTIQVKNKERWNRHCSNGRTGKKGLLYNSMRKHGINNFKYELLLCCSNLDDLNLMEELLIKEYDSMNREIGYNILPGGLNKRLTIESKIKLSTKILKQYENGRVPWNKGLKYFSGIEPWNKGKSGEYKLDSGKNISNALKGLSKSDDHRNNLSKARKEYSKNNIHCQSKFVKCINDSLIFKSASEAAIFYNLPITAAARVANGGRKAYKGLVFIYTQESPTIGVLR